VPIRRQGAAATAPLPVPARAAGTDAAACCTNGGGALARSARKQGTLGAPPRGALGRQGAAGRRGADRGGRAGAGGGGRGRSARPGAEAHLRETGPRPRQPGMPRCCRREARARKEGRERSADEPRARPKHCPGRSPRLRQALPRVPRRQPRRRRPADQRSRPPSHRALRVFCFSCPTNPWNPCSWFIYKPRTKSPPKRGA